MSWGVARRGVGIGNDIWALLVGSAASAAFPLVVTVLFGVFSSRPGFETWAEFSRLWWLWGSLGAVFGWWIGRHEGRNRNGPLKEDEPPA
jgi:hypothetical protein